MLAPMRYKNFVFPHNPRSYTITYERPTAVHKVPMGIYSVQDLGRTCRVMRGEGEFYGPEAYDTFKKLATVFYENGPGLLIHPVWQTSMAYFTELTLAQEPREDYVAYTFAFQEGFFGYAGLKRLDGGQEAETAEALAADTVYTVAAGDTLWAICQRYGVSLQALLKKNPQISNPNLITVGQKVRLP